MSDTVVFKVFPVFCGRLCKCAALHNFLNEQKMQLLASVLHLTQCNCLSFQHKKVLKSKAVSFYPSSDSEKVGGLDFFRNGILLAQNLPLSDLGLVLNV